MKKYFLFLFVLFYFGVASGATVEFHYCMDKLVDWGMAQPEESAPCGNCKMDASETKNCCKKEQQQVKVEKAQKSQFNFHFKLPYLVISDYSLAELSSRISPVIFQQITYAHLPPLIAKTPVFVFLRTFRI